MDLTLGPKNPDRLIRIRVHEFVLQFRSGSIHKATWEISTDDDASCFNIMSLKVLSYYDTDHSLSTDYTFYALAKMPNQCRYLVLCESRHDCGAFLYIEKTRLRQSVTVSLQNLRQRKEKLQI